MALLFIVASVFASIFFTISKSETFNQNKLINANMKIEVYGDDGNLLSDKSLFNSQYITLSKIPKETIDAFISIEDKTFYSHNGINPKRIVKAILNNISKGKASQGASTISQQLIKNTHLSSEKTYSRKIKEISLALEMEKKLSKDEILENYLNVIYYGNNIYGIENASQFYFSKSASELTLEEGATLAAIIKSPGFFDPIQHKERCLQRRNLVLFEMEKDGKISKETAQKARETDLVLKINETFDRGQNTYSQGAIMEAEEILKMPAKQIAIGKYKIHTFFSKEKQDALKAAIDSEELGFDQAGISINNLTHGIEAFYGKSAYNVLKTKRQPGSTIKPLLVYAPALNENIVSPATKILDEEININGYKPQNFEKTFRGHLSTREALSLSSNIPAVKILSYVGIPKAKRYATRLGIEFDENDNGYALALGGMTYGTDLKTLAAAYTTFANNGKFYGAKFIKRIEDENGKTIYEAKFVPDEVFREDSNYLMVSMMETSATKGTSKRLASLPFQIAGKSGTVGVGATNSDAFSVALTTKDTVATW
ncbi:MAG: transglycosylase domain-containing protein, partial [Eubacteriales bacterium]|nr:transglycosylase domain-containing protein [Eubacteriales bacterium]